MNSKLLALVLFLLAANLQAQFTIDGEIRPRTEFRNGYKNMQNTEGRSPEIITSQRSLLGVSFNEKAITSRIAFQDVRSWGESPTKKDSATIHLKEAWIGFPLNDIIRVKLGRQILKYDNQRILGATNWNNIGSQHDVLLFKLKSGAFQSDLGFAYNNEKGSMPYESYYPLPYYKAMSFLWLKYRFSNMLSASATTLVDLNAKPDTKDTYFARITYGATINFQPIKSLKINTDCFLQNGKNPSGTLVEAYMAGFRADYQLLSNHGIFLGTAIYSGSDPNSDPTNKTNNFDRLYGAKHKFLGYMDYFPIGKNGIQGIFAGTNHKFNSKLKLELSAHIFRLPHQYTDAVSGEKINQYLGTEVDIKASYKIAKKLNLTAIYGTMFGSGSMDIVKGGDHNATSNFAALMLTYKPSFTFIEDSKADKNLPPK
ncbi:alginate export family protein [Salinivirga cyanobacteriivorans]